LLADYVLGLHDGDGNRTGLLPGIVLDYLHDDAIDALGTRFDDFTFQAIKHGGGGSPNNKAIFIFVTNRNELAKHYAYFPGK
jgi:hypothetical protein